MSAIDPAVHLTDPTLPVQQTTLQILHYLSRSRPAQPVQPAIPAQEPVQYSPALTYSAISSTQSTPALCPAQLTVQYSQPAYLISILSQPTVTALPAYSHRHYHIHSYLSLIIVIDLVVIFSIILIYLVILI